MTADVEPAPVEEPSSARRLLERLYASPAVFAIVFALGFGLTFAPGAAIFLTRPDLPELYEQGNYDVVVAELRARQEAGKMAPEDWKLLGNALERRYGAVVREEMLGAYLVAAQNKRVDAIALHNTLVALGDEKYQQRAIEALAAWPPSGDGTQDPTALLARRVREESWLLRHGALAALQARRAPADVLAQAEAAVAITDITSWTCERGATPEGVRVLSALVAGGKAKDALRETIPASFVLEPHSVELGRVSACLKANELARLQTALAPIVKKE